MFNSLRTLFLRKTVILIVAMLLFTTVNVFGSVVQMTSGKVVDGEIVERNYELIRIDTGFGIPVTYYLDEIQAIDGEPVVPVKKVEAPKIEELPEAVETPKSAEKTDVVATRETPKTAEPPQEIKKTEKKEAPEKTAPAKDVATLEGIDLFKEQVSPVAVKPKEVSRRDTAANTGKRTEQRLMTQIDKNLGAFESLPVKTGPKEDFKKVLVQKINKYFQSYIMSFKETGAYIRGKMPVIKENLHAIPVKVRRDALVFMAAFMAILYVFVCFPLMQIAKKLERKHSWLIWIPLVQIVYFIYMAKQPLWLAILFFIPVLNAFLPLFLFMDILKLLRQPRWLIVFIIIPGVNVFTLWYLAISKANQPAK